MADDARENRDPEVGDMDDALFVNLILIFQGAAMQQMGKFKNPLTGKIERNLEQARFSIDTLTMLREKTRGNLPADLERLLESTLLNLRMNFVEESASGTAAPEAEAGDEPPAAGATAGGEASEGAPVKDSGVGTAPEAASGQPIAGASGSRNKGSQKEANSDKLSARARGKSEARSGSKTARPANSKSKRARS